MKKDERVAIVEVGPRDGFQSECRLIPTDLKVEVIDAISSTGVRKIEVTSFVNPAVIPQMFDSAEVMRRIKRVPGICYSVLVPNLKGAQRAIDARADAIRLVVCASETYNLRNIGRTIAETLKEFETLLKFIDGLALPEVIVSLCFGCPLEGDVPASQVVWLVDRLEKLGFVRMSIADSAGLANPRQVQSLMSLLQVHFPKVSFSLHLHDTRGLALANILAGWEVGVREFDASIGGLGGCPVVPGMTGNIATEDVVNMFNEMGVETGIQTQRVMECSRMIQPFLGRNLPSAVLRAGTRQMLFEGIGGK